MWDIKKLLIVTVLLIAIDSAYLYTNMKMFSEQIIKVQRVVMTFKPEGAIVCYFALVFGLYYFIIQPKKSPLDAFLLGLVIYAVYESTNYATLKKWSPYLAVMDTLWGGILFGTTTYLTYALT
jgi:uncharacterized membrane protein